MANASRTRGLLLIATGALVFVGTNTDVLPAEAFFPALAVCALGILSFVKANRLATEVEEARIRRALSPEMRNPTADAYAARQASADGRALASVGEREGRSAPPVASGAARPAPELAPDELLLDEISLSDAAPVADASADFGVSTDVSFPVELQESRSLAEQIERLQRLREEGVITADEFAVAKAKLLA